MIPHSRVHNARLSLERLSRESLSQMCTPPTFWGQGNLILQGKGNRRRDGITPSPMENLIRPRMENQNQGVQNENTRNYGT